MFRKLLRIEILLEMGTPQISQFLFFFLSVVNQDFQFDWEIPNTKKYFRKEEYQNVFWENIFWTFKQKLIILLHTCIKCYIRKHFFKKKEIVQFFLKIYHLDQSLCTKNCTPKNTQASIWKSKSKKKYISYLKTTMTLFVHSECQYSGLLFSPIYSIIILVKKPS